MARPEGRLDRIGRTQPDVALAPIAELPVLEIVGALHLIAHLTLPLGNIGTITRGTSNSS